MLLFGLSEQAIAGRCSVEKAGKTLMLESLF